MQQTPDVPRKLGSIHVLVRFLLRMIILSVFAALGSQGFGKTLESLLALAVLYCVFVAAVRREAPFSPVLTHFDEGAAYAVCAGIASWVV